MGEVVWAGQSLIDPEVCPLKKVLAQLAMLHKEGKELPPPQMPVSIGPTQAHLLARRICTWLFRAGISKAWLCLGA